MTYKTLNGLGPQLSLESLSHKIATCPTCYLQPLMLKRVTPKEAKNANTKGHAFLAMASSL